MSSGFYKSLHEIKFLVLKHDISSKMTSYLVKKRNIKVSLRKS